MIREPKIPEELLTAAASCADTAVISISRYSGEGWDRASESDEVREHKGEVRALREQMDRLFPRGDFYLSGEEEELLRNVCARFPKVAVVLNTGGVMDTARFKDDPGIGAVLLAWQGGMEGGLAEAELLCGIGCPEGRLSDTLAARLEDYPSSDTFHASDDYVSYYEDIYVGYRYFETIPGKKNAVVYPFGFGLSYTSFAIVKGDDLSFFH